MVTLVAIATYGNSRFRTAVEPVLAIGTAAVLVVLVSLLRARTTEQPSSG